MGQILKLDPKDTNRCFGCGGANDAGMKLAFVLDSTTGAPAAGLFSVRTMQVAGD